MSARDRNERDWRASAACRDENPELFFPTAEHGPAYDGQVAAAKRVCARCPVRAQCLAEALARIPAGIAGGLTEDERRGLTTATGAAGSASPRSRTQGGGRARAVAQLAGGRSCRAVAVEHGVSERTVQRWARGGVA